MEQSDNLRRKMLKLFLIKLTLHDIILRHELSNSDTINHLKILFRTSLIKINVLSVKKSIL